MSLSPVTRSGLPEKVMPGVVRRKVTSSVNRRGCWLRWVVQKARKPRADPMRSAKLGQAGGGGLEIAHRLGIRRAIRVHGVLAAKDRPASFYE